MSQSFWSKLERGSAATASLETLSACAAAVDAELAAFIQAQPAADLPRDIAHLRGQAAIVRFAESGGWQARVEETIDPSARRSRSVDVLLARSASNEIAVVELIDLLTDGGEAMRNLSDKVTAIRRVNSASRIAGVLALRGTRRNRATVAEIGEVVRARFAGSSAEWIASLRDPARPMPNDDGFVWASVDGSRLFAARWNRS